MLHRVFINTIKQHEAFFDCEDSAIPAEVEEYVRRVLRHTGEHQIIKVESSLKFGKRKFVTLQFLSEATNMWVDYQLFGADGEQLELAREALKERRENPTRSQRLFRLMYITMEDIEQDGEKPVSD